MLRRLPSILVVLALGTVPPLAGQDASLESRLPPEVLTAVQPVLDAARRDSLPLAPLESKILEGIAKGVPAERIAPVTERLALELRNARSLLRQELPATPLAGGEVSGAALAMRQGVPPGQLARLWENRPAQSLEIPLAVVGELARRGIPAEEAVEVMRVALEAGTPMSAAAQLPSRMDLTLSGAPAPQAALLEALRNLGIPIPPHAGGGRPGAPPGRPPGVGGGRPGG